MIYLGVQFNTVKFSASLSSNILEKYNAEIDSILSWEFCMLKDMQSIIGCLQWATNVVAPDKPFIMRLIDATCYYKGLFSKVRITDGRRADLNTWKVFFEEYSGKMLFMFPKTVPSSSLHFYSDASNLAFFYPQFSCGLLLRFV